ncbi:MAG: hypothetical protein QM710_09085 [Flavobacterium sp.]
MENLDKLSDEQLISLFQNSRLDTELKSKIIYEIDRRDLKTRQQQPTNLDLATKIRILLTSSFFYKQHLEQSSQLLANGDKKAYRLYWRYFICGIAFYGLLLLVFAKYYIKR